MRAQIIPDSTLPVNSVASLQDDTISITGGTVAGNNLFHSFQQFSLSTGSTAVFNNGAAIQNIISRVTGELGSNIDGSIRANGGANLFLINPNGIIFGPNARLDIGGSFLASTASSLNFADGTKFATTGVQANPLLTVSVPLGLQFTGAPSSIIVRGQGNNLSVDPGTNAFVRGENPVGLQVQPSKTLALVAGNVTLEGGNLIAEGGRLEVGSVNGSGLVNFSSTDQGWILGYENVPNYGDIQLSQQASVDASGEGGGSIQVQGRQVKLTDGSAIFAMTQGLNPGEAVVINASDSLELIGTSANGLFPSVVFTDTKGAGTAGNLTINTKQLNLRDGAGVTTDTFGAGKAGTLTVNASDFVQLVGISADRQFASGLFAETFDAGAGGDLIINTRQLLVWDGAYVSASTSGTGNAGTLTVNASDSVQVIGNKADSDAVSGLFAETFNVGAAGNLTINTRQLLIQDGAQVSASTDGAGDAGILTVNASDLVHLIETTQDGNSPSSLSALVGQEATGAGGNLTIRTKQLLVQGGAQVSTSTFGIGKAGNLTAIASDVQLSGESVNGLASGLFTSVQEQATGDGGNLTLETQRLSVRDGAQIAASKLGQGSAGSLTVKASESLELSSTSTKNPQRPSLTARTTGTGKAGDLKIETKQLSIRDGAQVTVSSEESGDAGNLEVRANSILLDNQGKLIAASASGTGGNIDLRVKDLILMRRQSLISAQAGNNGNGGNITINTPFIVAVPSENSDIVANAFRGNGGSINIKTFGIFGLEYRDRLTSNSDINASSDFGLDGAVEIDTPDIEPNQGLVELPVQLTQAQIIQACQLGRSQNVSEFVVTGRGGLPPNPSAPLNSDALWIDLDSTNYLAQNRSSSSKLSQNNNYMAQPLVEATGWMIGDKGEVILTASVSTTTPHSSGLTTLKCHAD